MIQCMAKAGQNRFYWSVHLDVARYDMGDILTVIPEPKRIGRFVIMKLTISCGKRLLIFSTGNVVYTHCSLVLVPNLRLIVTDLVCSPVILIIVISVTAVMGVPVASCLQLTRVACYILFSFYL